MSLTLAIALNITAAVVLVGMLAYAMTRPLALRPHVSLAKAPRTTAEATRPGSRRASRPRRSAHRAQRASAPAAGRA